MMISALRMTLAPASVLGIALFAVACGGFSEEEAVARCDQEEAARGAQGCFTAAAYDNCQAADEECGQDAEVIEECPARYVCPE